MTKLPCASIWSPASKLLQSLSVGSLEVTNPFAAGDLFSASNNFSNLNTEPAEKRVLFLSPQEDNCRTMVARQLSTETMPHNRFHLFLSTAGKEGMGLMGSGLASFLGSVYSNVHGSSLASGGLIILAVFLFGWGAYIAWSREHTERTNTETQLAELQHSPVDIAVEIMEMQKRDIPNTGTGDGPLKTSSVDIFVRVKLELKTIDSIVISRFRAELSLQGSIEHPHERKDIHNWRLFVGRRVGGGATYAYHHLVEVKQELKLGIPAEGWLHFVTSPTTDYQLEESSFKLIVETPRGGAHQELGGHTTKWYPVAEGKVVPDPDSTNIGMPNVE
jgi:hypothetical protein